MILSKCSTVSNTSDKWVCPCSCECCTLTFSSKNVACQNKIIWEINLSLQDISLLCIFFPNYIGIQIRNKGIKKHIERLLNVSHVLNFLFVPLFRITSSRNLEMLFDPFITHNNNQYASIKLQPFWKIRSVPKWLWPTSFPDFSAFFFSLSLLSHV